MRTDPLFAIDGRVALITGAGGGIGSALTRAFVARGATVAAVDREIELLEQLEASLSDDRSRMHSFSFDLMGTEQISELVRQVISRVGRIDVLVNNAGIISTLPVEEVTESIWDSIITVNLKASFFLAQTVVHHMRRQGGGLIINIASQLGIVGCRNGAPYAASKAALILLTKSLALDWAKDNIRVNAIAPGPLRTPMTEPFLQQEDHVRAATAAIPLGRIGSADEIVGAALLLASNASSYMTGSVVVVDGGYTAI